jgi:hypothetical protein
MPVLKPVASQYRCMPKCMPFLMSLVASLLRLNGKFKRDNFRHRKNKRMKDSQDVPQTQGSVFHGNIPTNSRPSATTAAFYTRRGSDRNSSRSIAAESGSKIIPRFHFHNRLKKGSSVKERDLDLRRRDLRVKGADLYVVRITKNGMGCAKPCWRW